MNCRRGFKVKLFSRTLVQNRGNLILSDDFRLRKFRLWGQVFVVAVFVVAVLLLLLHDSEDVDEALIRFLAASHHALGSYKDVFILHNFVELVISRSLIICRRLVDHDLTHFVDESALLRRQFAQCGKDEEPDAMDDLLQVKLLVDPRLLFLEELALLWRSPPVEYIGKVAFLLYLLDIF